MGPGFRRDDGDRLFILVSELAVASAPILRSSPVLAAPRAALPENRHAVRSALAPSGAHASCLRRDVRTRGQSPRPAVRLVLVSLDDPDLGSGERSRRAVQPV